MMERHRVNAARRFADPTVGLVGALNMHDLFFPPGSSDGRP